MPYDSVKDALKTVNVDTGYFGWKDDEFIGPSGYAMYEGWIRITGNSIIAIELRDKFEKIKNHIIALYPKLNDEDKNSVVRVLSKDMDIELTPEKIMSMNGWADIKRKIKHENLQPMSTV